MSPLLYFFDCWFHAVVGGEERLSSAIGDTSWRFSVSDCFFSFFSFLVVHVLCLGGRQPDNLRIKAKVAYERRRRRRRRRRKKEKRRPNDRFSSLLKVLCCHCGAQTECSGSIIERRTRERGQGGEWAAQCVQCKCPFSLSLFFVCVALCDFPSDTHTLSLSVSLSLSLSLFSLFLSLSLCVFTATER